MTLFTNSVFGFTFVELILDRIDFDRIDLIRIDFEVKWFIFGSSSKSDSDIKLKNFTSPKINFRGKNWFWESTTKYYKKLIKSIMRG